MIEVVIGMPITCLIKFLNRTLMWVCAEWCCSSRTVSEVNMDNGGASRMVINVDSNVGDERRLIPEFTVDNSGGGRRTNSEFNFYSGDESGGGRRIIPEIISMGKRKPPRSLHQLRVSVMEIGRSEMTDYVEKRTSKANQYYRNSDFIVEKERFPPPNKKSKINGSKKHASKVVKNCSLLLMRLMKHKHGWVFNAPIDVKGFGLRDYFLII